MLDTAPEAAFDTTVASAKQLADTPIALFSLVDADRQWFKSAHGLDATETSRDVAFCAHTIHQPHALIVPDATADERFATNPLVTGEPHIRHYAGFPVKGANGLPVGTLCVIDRRARTLSTEQISGLRMLANRLEIDVAERTHAAYQRMRTKRDRVRVAKTLNVELAATTQGLLAAQTALRRTELDDEQRMILAACMDTTAHLATLVDHVVLSVENLEG